MFIFVIVNKGSEKLLKEEISIKYPKLKFAYSRPGFLTFKNNDPDNFNIDTDTELNLVFARNYGISLGKYNKDGMEEYINSLQNNIKIHHYTNEGEIISGEPAKIGEEILDVVKISEDEYWIGTHKHKKYKWEYCGANPNLTLPEEAPSRAYMKLQEAILWSDYNVSDKTALEFGSAPGGATYALLEKGCKVYGSDMAKMSEICQNHPNYTHLLIPMQNVKHKDLPKNIDILLCDVNLSPMEAIPQILRMIKVRPMIDAVFYTMKIGNKVTVADIPNHIKSLRESNFKTIKATQLPGNKSEIFVFMQK